MEPKLIQPDGRESPYPPANGKDYTLEEMQTAVGGMIELVRLGSDGMMVINEEGKLEHMPVNPTANALAHQYHAIFEDDVIVGPALVCPARMVL